LSSSDSSYNCGNWNYCRLQRCHLCLLSFCHPACQLADLRAMIRIERGEDELKNKIKIIYTLPRGYPCVRVRYVFDLVEECALLNDAGFGED
jgi:hypothetical protein